jgi:hypothetical protein
VITSTHGAIGEKVESDIDSFLLLASSRINA